MQNKHKRRTGHRVNDQRSHWVNQNDKAILFSAHILRISLTSTLVNEKKKKKTCAIAEIISGKPKKKINSGCALLLFYRLSLPKNF